MTNANVTRQGRQKIIEYIRSEVAPVLKSNWIRNLEDTQQSLAQDIQIFSSSNIIQVGSRNPVLKYLEWGTRPHIITPDEAQALRWFNDDGEPVFRQKVRHPGFEPYAAMRTGYDQLQTEVNR